MSFPALTEPAAPVSGAAGASVPAASGRAASQASAPVDHDAFGALVDVAQREQQSNEDAPVPHQEGIPDSPRTIEAGGSVAADAVPMADVTKHARHAAGLAGFMRAFKANHAATPGSAASGHSVSREVAAVQPTEEHEKSENEDALALGVVPGPAALDASRPQPIDLSFQHVPTGNITDGIAVDEVSTSGDSSVEATTHTADAATDRSAAVPPVAQFTSKEASSPGLTPSADNDASSRVDSAMDGAIASLASGKDNDTADTTTHRATASAASNTSAPTPATTSVTTPATPAVTSVDVRAGRGTEGPESQRTAPTVTGSPAPALLTNVQSPSVFAATASETAPTTASMPGSSASVASAPEVPVAAGTTPTAAVTAASAQTAGRPADTAPAAATSTEARPVGPVPTTQTSVFTRPRGAAFKVAVDGVDAPKVKGSIGASDTASFVYQRPVTSARQVNPLLAGATFMSPSVSPVAATALSETVSLGAALDQQVTEQIVQTLRMQMMQGGGEARIELNPNYLGRVQVAVKVENGAVTANVVAETAEVREWVSSRRDELSQTLAQQGLRLDRLEVADSQKPQQQREQASRDSRQPDRESPRHRRETPNSSDVFELQDPKTDSERVERV